MFVGVVCFVAKISCQKSICHCDKSRLHWIAIMHNLIASIGSVKKRH